MTFKEELFEIVSRKIIENKGRLSRKKTLARLEAFCVDTAISTVLEEINKRVDGARP